MAAASARRLGLFLALIALLTVTGLTLIGQAGADDGDSLPAPTELRASTERGSLDVALDWNDVDGAASYSVRWRVAEPGNRLNDGISVQSSDAVITVAIYGEWVARVQACDDAGCGAPVATKFRVRKPRATPEVTPLPTSTPTPLPTATPTLQPTSTPISAPTTGELQVSVSASTVTPLINQAVTLRATVSNAPSDSNPSYRWAMHDGESWFSHGTGSTFSYLADRPEAWSFRVTVTYGSGASVTSAPITVTWVESQPTPTVTPTPEPVSTSTPTLEPSVAIPDKPAGLATSTHPGSQDVSLDWDDVTGAAHYWVRWRASGPDASLNEGIVVLPSEAVVGVSGYGEWMARVQACNDMGCGAPAVSKFTVEPEPTATPTATATATAIPTPTPTATATPVPAPELAPASLRLSPVLDSDGNMTMTFAASWDAVEGVTSYSVRWRQVGGEFESSNAATVTGTSANITLSGYGSWQVRVRGCNDAGCGPEVEQAVALVQIPGEPDNLEVNAEPGSLSLLATWDAVDGASSYKLRWRQSGGDFKADNAATVTDATQFITVSDYGQWEIRVQNCNDDACGAEASRTVDVVKKLRSSLEPAQDAGGNDRPRSITANWDPVPGAASYTLQWQRIGVNLPEQEQAQRNGALRQARSASGVVAQKVNAQPENRITVPADQTSAEFNLPDGGAYEVELQARAAGNELIARSNHHVNQAPDQPDTTPPRLVRGEMDGDRMFLYFSEPLNESIVGGLLLTYVQYANCYCSTGGWYGVAMEVSGNKVIVDFKGSIRAVEGLSASVSYWVRPGDTSLRDLAGNKVWTPNVHYGGSRSTGNISLRNITGRPFVTDVAISSDAGDDRFYDVGDSIRVTLTFSEEVNVTGTPRLKIDLDPADGGERWADYSGGSGTVELAFGYTVVEGDISTDGVAVLRNTLELNGGAIRSATAITVEDARLGHAGLSHNSTHKVVTPNTAAPLLVSASVTGTTLTLTFSESLSAAASLANSAFTVKKTPQGAPEQTVSLSGSPVIDGATVTLTLASPVIATDTGVKVSYAKPASGSNNKLVDADGAEVASFTDRIVTSTADTTPPRLVRAQVNSNVITLFFSEPLDEYSGGEGDYLRVSMRVAEYGGRSTTFTIKSEVVEGDTTVKGDVRIAGNKVTVGLPLRTLSGYGLYTIYYVRPLDPVGDRFRDLAGNAVWAPHDRGQYDAYTRKPLRSTGSIELVNVTAPPALESATVSGNRLTLTFDEALNKNSVPAASAFTVKVNNSSVGLASVNPVAISDKTVTLTLVSAVAAGADVKVSYNKPSNSPLKGVDGKAPSFTDEPVTNLTQ